MKDSLLGQLSQQLDYELQLDLLRKHQQRRTKELKEQYLSRKIPLPTLFSALTQLAEEVLEGGLTITKQELLKKMHPPTGGFAIVAMGKFGGGELTFYSDLDIIYLYEKREDQDFYTRLGQRIISALSIRTCEGYAYLIDTALRPSGNGGTLVSTLQSFENYHRKSAKTWEQQALIKAKPILGDNDFLSKIGKIIETIAYQKINPSKVREDIRRLRERMEQEIAKENPGHYDLKTGSGGIIDIEFLVQYLQLLHGNKEPSVRCKGTIESLQSLGNRNILDSATIKKLEESYFYFREIESHLRIILERSAEKLDEKSETLVTLKKNWNDFSLEEFLNKRKGVRLLFDKVFAI